MPNYCDYTMKVVGKKKNIITFLEWLKNDYHYYSDDDHEALKPNGKERYLYEFVDGDCHLLTNADKHFWRVFDAYAEKEDIVKEDDNKYSLIIFGDCAWSVYCCMMEGEHTYHDDNSNDDRYGAVQKLSPAHSTTLEQATAELDLDVEVYSCEPGCAFWEHYIVRKGDIELDDTGDYFVCYKEGYKDDAEIKKEIKKYMKDFNEKYLHEEDEAFIYSKINPFNPEWNI